MKSNTNAFSDLQLLQRGSLEIKHNSPTVITNYYNVDPLKANTKSFSDLQLLQRGSPESKHKVIQ